MPESSRPVTSERVQQFVQWFEGLEPDDQEVLMGIVYKEKKIREVVKSLGTMGQDQRQEVFQRLGLPTDLLARIPPPDPTSLLDVEVEWEDWKAPGV
jgi:hypothetical protein